MTTESANTHPFYKSGLPLLVGVLVSILVGYGVLEFSDISGALAGAKIPEGSACGKTSEVSLVAWVIAILATFIIVANLFRLAHGLTIAMRDPRYDKQVGVRFNLRDMARCVTIIVVPFFCLEVITSDWLAALDDVVVKNFFLILAYMLPHAVYLGWDLHLLRRLKKKAIDIGFLDCALFWLDWRRPRASYEDWLKVWLGLDMWVILALVVLAAGSVGVSFGLGENTWNFLLDRTWLVGLFAGVSAISLSCDYVCFNRRYYFPR